MGSLPDWSGWGPGAAAGRLRSVVPRRGALTRIPSTPQLAAADVDASCLRLQTEEEALLALRVRAGEGLPTGVSRSAAGVVKPGTTGLLGTYQQELAAYRAEREAQRRQACKARPGRRGVAESRGLCRATARVAAASGSAMSSVSLSDAEPRPHAAPQLVPDDPMPCLCAQALRSVAATARAGEGRGQARGSTGAEHQRRLIAAEAAGHPAAEDR